MLLNFTKMHALSNDFMVLDGVRQTFTITPAQVRAWACRRTGIGFDQLLIAAPAHDARADFYYRIFNADGSEAANCGNGARCLALFLRNQGLIQKSEIVVETLAGLLTLQCEDNNLVTVAMGVPTLEPATLPMLLAPQAPLYNLDVAGQTVHFAALALGNPHIVITVPDITVAPVEAWGTFFNKHPAFLQGVNVGCLQIIDAQTVRLRVYERGVGLTPACGSGACAAMVAGHLAGALTTRVEVQQPGGAVWVEWVNTNAPVLLTGAATSVFDGQVII